MICGSSFAPAGNPPILGNQRTFYPRYPKTNSMTIKSHKTITVVPYDTAWPEQFEQEAALIKQALGIHCLEIHHVGSTAVPGLAAKPVIDIIAVVENQEASIAPLQVAGYQHKGEYNIPLRAFFNKNDGLNRINLHVYPQDHPERELNLTFRNYLRANPDAVTAYAKLKYDLLSKTQLFAKYPSGFTDYTLGKHAFIQAILTKAGFNRIRMTYVTHHNEWEAAKNFRRIHFLRQGLTDPFSRIEPSANHRHLALYQGAIIVGYSHVELLPEGRTRMHMIELEESHAHLRQQFLDLCTVWLTNRD